MQVQVVFFSSSWAAYSPGKGIYDRFTPGLSPGNKPLLKREFIAVSFFRSFCF